DGCVYVCSRTLAPCSHNYYFSTSDGYATASTTTVSGPTVTNNAPTLASGSVSPGSGTTATTFTYTVTYTDADNDAPSCVRVYIDGSYHTMSKQNSGDVTYTDGCVYVYNLTLAPAPHSYSFGASDRFATISTNTVFGPNVAPPETSISWSVSPAIGDANTRFTFTFLYNYSVNPPSEVMVHVAGVGYQMSKLYPGDAIYTDGCVYECSMTIPAGLHEYYFFSQTPDGINFTSGPGRLLVMESSIDGELPVSIPPVMLLLVICVFATFSTVSLVKRIKSKKYIAQPNMPDLTIPTSAYLQSTYSSLDDVPEPIRARLARPVILESTPVPSPARAGQAQNQAIPAIPGSLKWTRMARYRILPDNVGDSRAIGDTGRSRVAGDSTGAFTTPCKLTRPGSAPAAVLVVKRSLRESMVSRSVSMNGHGSITCPTCMERIPAKISSGNDAPSCPLCLTSLPFEITCHACTATTTITRDELQTKDAMSLRCPVCMEPFTR
ncbi:MAG: hypothetical protein GYA24_06995, partial [Candidatus Lokiarchaeota archaeon]|nr:hypothetical protein [Candidatus Lokiarchaeota archaeon]